MVRDPRAMRHPVLTALIAVALCLPATPAGAVVTSTISYADFTGSGSSSFPFTFPVLSTSHLTAVRYTGACGSATYTILAVGSCADCYTAVRSSTGGTVTTVTAVAVGECLRVSRVVPVTQTTSFRTQSSFSPKSHEEAFDKLTMLIQQVQDGVTQSEETATAIEDHIASADDHTAYAKLAGRSGGQTLYGGTVSGDDLVLLGNVASDGDVYLNGCRVTYGDGLICGPGNTSFSGTVTVSGALAATGSVTGGDHADDDLVLTSTGDVDKGFIYAGALSLDEDGGLVGIGTLTPAQELHVIGESILNGTLYDLAGSTAVDGDLYLTSTANADKDLIRFGASSAYDEQNVRLGIGTIVPTSALDVVGTGDFSGNLYVHLKAGIGTSSPTNDLEVRGTFSGRHPVTSTSGSDTAVVTTDCGAAWYLDTNGTTLTLPALSADNLGCEITLVVGGAAGAVQVKLAAGAGHSIFGTCGATTFAGTSGNDAQNTLATHQTGDSITVLALTADAAKTWWYITRCTGVWADVP